MIHVLIGTRAQLIKMIPIMHQMKSRGIDYNFIFMAQHRETIYEMLEGFKLKKPDYVLCDTGSDIVSTKQMILWSLKVLYEGILSKNKIFKEDKNGIVLIHGDAPPLLLGAVIAKLQGLQTGSVEAGLRSFNWWKPFPEEITRVVTAKLRLIDVYYCQDETAISNIKSYRGRYVHTQGNTISDSIRLALKINQHNNSLEPANKKREIYAVVTLHRFETISNAKQLRKVVALVQHISKTINLIFILHPPTKAALINKGLFNELNHNSSIRLLPRMSFIDFNRLLSASQFIITDGGSNQEESAFLGIPCLLFRNETERLEGLGKNVVLSKFDISIIDEFVENYKNYLTPISSITSSPTSIILDDVVSYT